MFFRYKRFYYVTINKSGVIDMWYSLEQEYIPRGHVSELSNFHRTMVCSWGQLLKYK